MVAIYKTEELVIITYKNHRGEVTERRIQPGRLAFATSEWHPGPPQWFIVAFDLGKGATRHFALKDISKWEGRSDGQ